MYIDTFELESFRGFQQKASLSFAIPNGQPGSGLTLLVGPNGGGKTSILNAINYFRKNQINLSRLDKNQQTTSEPKLKMSCCSHTTNDKTILETKRAHEDLELQLQITSPTGVPPTLPLLWYTRSRRPWQSHANGTTNEQQLAQEFAARQPGQYQPYNNISSYIRQLLLSDQAKDQTSYDHFKRLLKQVFPFIKSFNLGKDDSDNFRLQAIDTSGAKFFADALSDGSLNIIPLLLQLSTNNASDKTILLIDEPELSLHPQTIRRLAKVLIEQSSNQQLIVATHSPILLEHAFKTNAYIIHVWNSPTGAVTTTLKPDHGVINQVKGLNTVNRPYQNDSTACELFFTDKVLFVEGQEDVACLNSGCKQLNLDCEFLIFGYGCGGADGMIPYLSLAQYLQIHAAVLLDGDDKGNTTVEKIKTNFPNVFHQQVSTTNIRDKIDYKINIDWLDDDWKIKPEHQNKFTNIVRRKKEELPAVEGIFSSNGQLKEDKKKEFLTLIDNFNNHFKGNKNIKQNRNFVCSPKTPPKLLSLSQQTFRNLDASHSH